MLFLLLESFSGHQVLVANGFLGSVLEWSHEQLLDRGYRRVSAVTADSWLDARAALFT